MIIITCKNCNHQFQGNYCNNCGQSADTHDVNFKYITHEIQHGIIHIDKGILFTIKELFTRPGNSIREYLEGKRVSHFKPLAFLFLVSTLYALLAHISEKETSIEEFFTGMMEGTKGDKSNNIFFIIVSWLANHYAYTNVLLIPVMSFASYLAFKKANFNYFQHIILNSFIAGQRIIAFLVLIPIVYFFKGKNIENWFDIITTILGVVLTVWTYFQFFNSLNPF